MGSGVVVVWVSCPSAAVAKRIARSLVEERLAACVGVIPMSETIFHWKGKVERAHEVLLMIKARRSAFSRLRRRVRALHPYEVPEIIATAVVRGDPAYLSWVKGR